MSCAFWLVFMIMPCAALVLMWISTTYIQRAFHGGLALPVIGFIFLPFTTIVYTWEFSNGMPTAGINLLWLAIAVIVDLAGLGSSVRRQSRR